MSIRIIQYGSTYYNTFTIGSCSKYHGFFFSVSVTCTQQLLLCQILLLIFETNIKNNNKLLIRVVISTIEIICIYYSFN